MRSGKYYFMNSGIIFSKGDAWETTYLSSPNAWRHLTQCLERRELQAPFLNVDKSYDSLENVTLRHYNLVVRSWCQRSRYRTTCILVGFNFPACERSLPRPEAPPKPMVHGGLQKKVPHITMLRRSNSTSAVVHSLQATCAVCFEAKQPESQAKTGVGI